MSQYKRELVPKRLDSFMAVEPLAILSDGRWEDGSERIRIFTLRAFRHGCQINHLTSVPKAKQKTFPNFFSAVDIFGKIICLLAQ